MRSLMFCTPQQTVLGNQIQNTEMSRACSKYGGEERCLQGFDRVACGIYHLQDLVVDGRTILTIRDGRHAKHRQNGLGVLFTPWGIFILYNATSTF
jgi:hypothetical protein